MRTFALDNLTESPDGRWAWRFDARGLKGWMEHAAAGEEAHWAALRRMSCPALVIRAGDSPFTDASAAERMVQEIPQARRVEVAGSGHDIHIDRLQALLAELEAFLTAR